MKKIVMILFTATILLHFQAFAENKMPRLNKVMLRFNAEEWVTTKTAKVIVNIDAILDKEGVANLHQIILDKLQVISKKLSLHGYNFVPIIG